MYKRQSYGVAELLELLKARLYTRVGTTIKKTKFSFLYNNVKFFGDRCGQPEPYGASNATTLGVTTESNRIYCGLERSNTTCCDMAFGWFLLRDMYYFFCLLL